MAVVDLPVALKRAHENFWLVGASGSGGRGLDGRENIMFTENRYWVGQLDLVHLFGDDILTARSVGTRLRGRANQLRLTFSNSGTTRFLGDPAAFYASIGVASADVARGYSLFSDGTKFDDGTGFALPDYAEPTVVTAASEGASTLKLAGYLGGHLAIGARFSINDFMYEVEANEDGAITFSPPLREAVVAGALAKVSAPSVLVRMTDDRGWEPFTNYGHHAKPMSVAIEESFDR